MLYKLNYVLDLLNRKKYNNKLDVFIETFKNYNLYQLELIFKLSSSINNKNKFIIMSILIEKFLSNKLIFLLDKKTLSNNKFIKIGYISHIQSDKLFTLLELCGLYNFPKFYNSDLMFDFSKSNFMKYENKKLLSNFIFHLDKNITYYYSYLNEFEYHLSFLFKTNFDDKSFNKILFSLYNYNFVLRNNILFNSMLNNVLLDTDLDESEDDDDFLNNEFIVTDSDTDDEERSYISSDFNETIYISNIKEQFSKRIYDLISKDSLYDYTFLNERLVKEEFNDIQIDLILFDEILSDEIIFDYNLFL